MVIYIKECGQTTKSKEKENIYKKILRIYFLKLMDIFMKELIQTTFEKDLE